MLLPPNWRHSQERGSECPRSVHPIPLSLDLLQRQQHAVAVDMGTLLSWLKSGGEAVPHTVAQRRALICAQCPLNKRGGIISFFTRRAAKLIQEQIERKQRLELWTSVDALLGICKACRCVMELKVHTPPDVILANLKTKTRAKLDPDCWILKL